MSEQPEREGDQEPKPTEQSDAQRLSSEESERVPAREDAEPAEGEDESS
jgi:hypothetical protein